MTYLIFWSQHGCTTAFWFSDTWECRKYWEKPLLCDNEALCCQSALDLSTFVVLCVSHDVFRHTDKHTFALPRSECTTSSYLQDAPTLSTSPSPSACCLFIRQTICWSCVFFSPRRPPGTLLHVAVLYQLSDACGTPSVSRCPLHRHEVSVFTPGSLSARRRIMGRVRDSPLSALLIVHLASWLASLCDQQ